MPKPDKSKRCFGELYFAAIAALFCLVSLFNSSRVYAAEGDLEYTIDLNANTIPLPKIFSPNIDLSGRGFYSDPSWPQSLAAPEALDAWEKNIGWNGIYRLQYNLWEISQQAKDKQLQDKLLANYESVIKRVSDAGGTVILDIFSTPQGQGKVLDKKSSPVDLKDISASLAAIRNTMSGMRSGALLTWIISFWAGSRNTLIFTGQWRRASGSSRMRPRSISL